MDRVALFVDAGYLFAQGSTAIWGAKQAQATLDLNEAAAVAELLAVATAKAPKASLLRIYWYDGAKGGGPSMQQLRLGQLDNIKLRLGFINSQGQQKGVDSLIVTDLVELARNGVITDAVLLAGDEDVRIGVQIAQSYGVRVHLLGISGPHQSQSPQLMQEADTKMLWNAATMARMISQRIPRPVVVVQAPAASAGTPPAGSSGTSPSPAGTPAPAPTGGTPIIDPSLDAITDALIASLDAADVALIKAYWTTQRGVPAEFDGKLIASGRAAINRNLSIAEKRYVRTRFSTAVRALP